MNITPSLQVDRMLITIMVALFVLLMLMNFVPPFNKIKTTSIDVHVKHTVASHIADASGRRVR